MRRSIVLVIAAMSAGILAGGAVGISVGASSVPQLHACVTKTTLLMRYTASTCHTGEKLLTWNVAGIAGAKGATGATGPAGAPGAQGPAGPAGGSGSAPTPGVYVSQRTEATFGGAGTLIKFQLPAGHYLLNATISLRAVTAPGTVTCSISSPTANFGSAATATNGVTTTFGALSILTYAELTAPAVIAVSCTSDISTQHDSVTVYATPAQLLPAVQ